MNDSADGCVTSLESVKICKDTDLLGAVLNDLKSSHDAVFVYDEKNKFLGLVSPQQVLYHHHYPSYTKVKNTLIKPIKLTVDTPLHLITEFMTGTRMYTLPVFGQSTIIGVITADSIITSVTKNKSLFRKIADQIKIKKPITANVASPVKDIYALCKEKNVSRIILTDQKNAIMGIVSRRDIFPVSLRPDQQRSRTSTAINGVKHMRLRDQTFDSERILSRNDPVAIYMTQQVVSVPVGTSLITASTTMLAAGVNSIVFAKNNTAAGIITRYDFLKALSQLRPTAQVPIIFEMPATNLPEQLYQQVALAMTKLFAEKMTRRDPIGRIEVHFKKNKNVAKKTKLIEAHIQLHLQSGKNYYATGTDHRIDDATRAALEKIEHQCAKVNL